MKREVLLLYLRDLRDLEIAKKKIMTIYNREKNIYIRKRNSLGIAEVKPVPEEDQSLTSENMGSIGGLTVLIFVSILLAKLFFGWSSTSFALIGDTFFAIGIVLTIVCVVCIIGLIIIIWNARDMKKENEQNIINIMKYNEKEQERVRDNENAIKELNIQWRERETYLKSEYEKVCLLLKDNYSLNILANQYRNLESLYYIYDYMSSSQESLKDTLVHEHMENGIQRILERLDYIIEQNEKIIFNGRLQESANQQIISQNNEMISSLKENERNISIATQYAEISANYNKATAYFSLATYLKN